MLEKVVGIKAKSDWLLKFQLKKSAKKVKNFELFFPPTFSALLSDIAQSCLNCACTQENLARFWVFSDFLAEWKTALSKRVEYVYSIISI